MSEANGSPVRQPLISRPLMVRTLSALVLIPAAILVVYVGGWVLAALVGAAGAIMLHEWNSICESEASPGLYMVEVAILIAVSALIMTHEPAAAALTAVIGLAITVIVAQFLQKKMLWAAAGLFYAIIPAAAILWLRQETQAGFALCIWAMALVWATDIGGYAAGRRIGGPKLAPRLSPNKTWSGLGGGMIFAAVTSAVLGAVLGLAQSWGLLALTGAGLAVWAQIGDLFESAIKRRFGVKDSGSLIPGHGGIMDRVDGLVFVMPVVAVGVRLF